MQKTIPTENPSLEAIAYCAYMIWEKEGRPAGRDREHWLEAEAQLRAAGKRPGVKSKRPPFAKDATVLSRAA